MQLNPLTRPDLNPPARKFSAQISRNSAQPIRSIPLYHITKNPFQSSTRKQTTSPYSKKHYVSQFINYKLLPNDVDQELLPDTLDQEYEQRHTRYPINNTSFAHKAMIAIIRKESKEYADEMDFEIKLDNALTDFVEKELKIIKTLPPVRLEDVKHKFVKLPESDHPKTIVLDLDETLIYTLPECYPQQVYNKLLIHSIKYQSEGITLEAQYLVRPYLDLFLTGIAKDFELILFTSAEKDYADKIIDKIDQSHLIKYKFYREHCFNKKGFYVKDLRIINRDPKNCIAIDNSITPFMRQLDNLINVTSFHGESEDDKLLSLIIYLRNLLKVDDVRMIIKETNMFSLLLSRGNYA